MTHGDELGIGPSDLLVCIAYLATADYRTLVATTDLKTLASQTRLKPDTITAAKKRLAAAGLLDIDFTSKPHVCDVMPLMTRLNNLAGPARQDRREKMVYDLHGRRAVVHGRPGGR